MNSHTQSGLVALNQHVFDHEALLGEGFQGARQGSFTAFDARIYPGGRGGG